MEPEKIAKAVGQLGLLKFFPPGDDERAGIMDLLDRMVSTEDQLAWLVRAMIDRVGIWEGTRELRGVFCSKFRPKDGVDANCNGVGAAAAFSGETSESLAIQSHAERQLLAQGSPPRLQLDSGTVRVADPPGTPTAAQVDATLGRLFEAKDLKRHLARKCPKCGAAGRCPCAGGGA